MREYLYRGKDKRTGQWVYGNLFENAYKKGEFRIGYLGFEKGLRHSKYKVVENHTIGCYVGLKDRNDRKMFEGDILCDKNGTFLVIKWDSNKLRYVGYTPNTPLLHRDLDDEYIKRDFEVVANVYDLI